MTKTTIPTDPLERFFYWIQERYQIHHLRKQDVPKPWTKDEILQTVFFTNPYREDDKTTEWFRENVRGPLRNKQEVLFATLAFRLFNYISTGEILQHAGLLERWRKDKAKHILHEINGKVFTGAYIIKLYNGMSKIDAACDILDLMWKDRERLYEDLTCRKGVHRTPPTLEYANSRIMKYPQMGPFMAYEVVCDLRYTHILENAPDIMTWANVGPGANRGLFRIFGDGGTSFARGETPKFPGALDKMRELLRLSTEYLPHKGWAWIGSDPVKTYKIPPMPKLELREVEHSLCEYDKYERSRTGDGKLKRYFDGKA